MTWTLRKSRGLYFNKTGDDPTRSAWVAETDLLATAGFGTHGDDLMRWDPSAADAQANCPVLHEVLASLKTTVGPSWKARARNIYAGRTRNAHVPTAMSATGQKGGAVAIGFDFTYCLMGAAITWAQFLRDVDTMRQNPSLGANAEAMRRGALAAFAKIRERGVDGIEPSKIFHVSSDEEAHAAAVLQQRAEVWVLAHEIAHHILRDGTSRPDAEAVRTVRAFMEDPEVSIELVHATGEQHAEIHADILAYLLTCGEFIDGRHPRLEMISASGALLGLLAVGLMNDDWISSAGDSHPATLTRMAVIARVAARRILQDERCEIEEREELIRILASILSYAAWISGVSIAPPPREDQAVHALADLVLASTMLMLPWEGPIFDERSQ